MVVVLVVCGSSSRVISRLVVAAVKVVVGLSNMTLGLSKVAKRPSRVTDVGSSD